MLLMEEVPGLLAGTQKAHENQPLGAGPLLGDWHLPGLPLGFRAGCCDLPAARTVGGPGRTRFPCRLL